jgi:hypothetical protein
VRHTHTIARCYPLSACPVQTSRASSERRMLLARAALACLRPPAAPLRRRLARAMSAEAVVSVTEVHATRWLRCVTASLADLLGRCMLTRCCRRLNTIKYTDAAGVERVRATAASSPGFMRSRRTLRRHGTCASAPRATRAPALTVRFTPPWVSLPCAHARRRSRGCLRGAAPRGRAATHAARAPVSPAGAPRLLCSASSCAHASLHRWRD